MTERRRIFRGFWLGTRRYAEVLALQDRLAQARIEGRIDDVLLLLEHEPVITLGRRANPENLLLSQERLAERGIDLFSTRRGGDVTLHAPGQLVCYPIIDLKPDRCDVRKYVRDLTETMRRLSLRHGVAGGTVDGMIGLWVDRESPCAWPGGSNAGALSKLGAIGVHLSHWVTTHGFALNYTTDSRLFGLIVPCGIREHGVATLEELTGRTPDLRDEAVAAAAILGELFDADVAALEDLTAGLEQLDVALAE